ncbi:potassium-transporting ATPase subunit KdpC [Pseudarthrobacter equi]|uniref:potassium-transporting ATPase subunit KdpC n=1 Tax=Pseudarthrobacter equi TaxID=728066 RepID=UPI0021C0543A|nr:potassium-transporting ATPase subunit KdpC [Pseudarthrobacter equi]MCT9627379.1 potassium-transporting ATPase subunit KdpC [Pseudarthrobacter equi]
MNTLTGYLRQAGTALRFLVLATLVLGVAYPVAVFGVGQVLAPYQANGSIIRDDSGAPAASALIAQAVSDDNGVQDPRWFHARPSAVNWDPAASSASNLGPNDPKLVEAVKANRSAVAAEEGISESEVPADAVTASGSGLDPHISPEYARVQVDRVAAAHGLAAEAVSSLVDRHTSSGLLAFLGQPSVNVTALNLALAAASQSS